MNLHAMYAAATVFDSLAAVWTMRLSDMRWPTMGLMLLACASWYSFVVTGC